MLVFCEDCGARNNIDVNTVRKAGNQYRCQNCNFLNLLLVKQEKVVKKRRNTPLDRVPYLRIFKEIIHEQDILGACIYNRSEGILAADLPEDLPTAAMETIAQALIFCRTMGSKVLKETDDTYIVLTNQVVVGRSLTKELTLIICCPSYPLAPRTTTIIDKAIKNFYATQTAFWRP